MNFKNEATPFLSPFQAIVDLNYDLNQVFDEWVIPRKMSKKNEQQLQPVCEILENDQHYLMTLEVPGFAKNDLRVETQGNQLMISGERKEEFFKKEKGAVSYSERSSNKFQRFFTLPNGIDAHQIESYCKDGILRMIVPKSPEHHVRSIEIMEDKEASPLLAKWFKPKTSASTEGNTQRAEMLGAVS